MLLKIQFALVKNKWYIFNSKIDFTNCIRGYFKPINLTTICFQLVLTKIGGLCGLYGFTCLQWEGTTKLRNLHLYVKEWTDRAWIKFACQNDISSNGKGHRENNNNKCLVCQLLKARYCKYGDDVSRLYTSALKIILPSVSNFRNKCLN